MDMTGTMEPEGKEPPPTVRLAGAHDAEGIALAVLDAPQFAAKLTGNDLKTIVGRAERAVLSVDGQQTLLVAELRGEVAGYAHVHWVSPFFLPGPEGYISSLFVRRSARGRGCGRALLHAIRSAAVERKAARLFLVNGRQTEAYSRAFYPSNGFTEASHLASFRWEVSPADPGD